MAEYISTFKACNLLGISHSMSWRMTKDYRIRSKKNLSYKMWNMDDIQRVLDRREAHKNPPDGWIRIKEATEILGWSEPVSRSILINHGLTPKIFRLWTKGKRYVNVRCWNKKAVHDIAMEVRLERRKHPPEGWLTFADVMDYLGFNKNRTRFWLNRFNVGYKVVNARRRHYCEDDVVAMRKALRNSAPTTI